MALLSGEVQRRASVFTQFTNPKMVDVHNSVPEYPRKDQYVSPKKAEICIKHFKKHYTKKCFLKILLL